jgi:hypothetical protein
MPTKQYVNFSFWLKRIIPCSVAMNSSVRQCITFYRTRLNLNSCIQWKIALQKLCQTDLCFILQFQ